MNKQEFIKEYSIKDAMPIDPSLRVLPAEGVAEAIEEFIGERFRGVARAGSSVATYGGLLVCPDYLAYFFKALFTEIYGRCFIEINITNNDERLFIAAEVDGYIPISDVARRNLIKIARNAGAEVSLSERGISLSFRFEDAAIRRVYAISVNDGRHSMLSKLGELFYCGEELDSENPPTLLPKKAKGTARGTGKVAGSTKKK